MILVTSSSSYVLDRETMTAKRYPGRGLDVENWTVSELRQDEAPIQLLEWPTPVVGERCTLVLTGLNPKALYTLRDTTPVTMVIEGSDETYPALLEKFTRKVETIEDLGEQQ